MQTGEIIFVVRASFVRANCADVGYEIVIRV